MNTIRITPDSSWNLPATDKQVRAIARLCTIRGISEPLEDRPMTRYEARQLIYDLRIRRKEAANG